MNQTITEKIIAAHAHLDQVRPGQMVEVDVDLALANDITAPISIKVFKDAGVEKVFDPQKIVLVPDHFVPNKDIESAQLVKEVRTFAHNRESSFFSSWLKWGSSMPSFLKRDWSCRAIWLSGPTATPAPTVLWGPSLRAWAVLT